jgi:hypothetical protein
MGTNATLSPAAVALGKNDCTTTDSADAITRDAGSDPFSFARFIKLAIEPW